MEEIIPVSLKIFLLVCIGVFLLYVVKSIKDGKIEIRHALLWILIAVLAAVSVFFANELGVLAGLVGVKTTSNLVFLLGFVFLVFVTFSLTRTVGAQSKKITKLTQELALLRKKLEEKGGKK